MSLPCTQKHQHALQRVPQDATTIALHGLMTCAMHCTNSGKMTHHAPVLITVSPSVSSEVATRRMTSPLAMFARTMLAAIPRSFLRHQSLTLASRFITIEPNACGPSLESDPLTCMQRSCLDFAGHAVKAFPSALHSAKKRPRSRAGDGDVSQEHGPAHALPALARRLPPAERVASAYAGSSWQAGQEEGPTEARASLRDEGPTVSVW